MESSGGVLTECIRRTWTKEISWAVVVRVSFLEEVDSVVWIHTLEYHMERVFPAETTDNEEQMRKS